MPLDPGADRVPLWAALQTVADPQGELTAGRVGALVAAGDATPLPHANHAFGKWLPYPYWAQLTLSNPGPEPQAWLLTYELPTQDEVRLWIQDDQGQWVEHPQLENLRPLAPTSGLLYPAWRLKLQGEQKASLMLRLDGYNLMRFPLFAVRDDAFVLTQGKLHLWIGLVLAVPLVVVLYVLTLIPVAADRSLPLFLAMAACEMLGAMWVSGVMHQLLPWLDRWQAGWLGWAGYVGLLGLSALHARVFLGTREDDPVADVLLRAGAWLWLVVVPAIAILRPETSRLMLVMGGTVATLDVLVIALLGLGFFEVVLGAMRHYLFSHTTHRVDVELGSRLFQHLIHLPMAYFGARRSGDTVARVRELENARNFLTGTALTGWLDLGFAFVFLAVMFHYSATLTLIVMAALPVLFAASWIITPFLRSKLEDKFTLGAENQTFLQETVGAMETLKSQAVEPAWQREWERRQADYVHAAFESGHLGNATQQFIGLASKVLTVLLLYFGARLVIDGELTVGGLIAFNMLAGRVNAPILKLASVWQEVTQMKVSIQRLAEIMDAQPEPAFQPGRSAPPALEGRVTVDHVTFRYAPQAPEVLAELTLEVNPGEIVGITGLSGAGKTTLMRLVQRLYVPERGRVLVDGMDLAHMDAAWLRRQIGVVGQDTVLFNRSVRENIALGRTDIPMEKIMDAARLAGAHDFILQLPDGYDTVIGERGSRLSGGQRARVAAQNDVELRQAELQRLLGDAPGALQPMDPVAALPPLPEGGLDRWLDAARAGHPGVRLQLAAVDAARADVKRQTAGHSPSLDLTANYGPTYASGSMGSPADIASRVRTAQLGVTFTLPLYAGGGTQSRVREALALSDKAEEELEAARRQASTLARQAYAGLVNGQAQVEALASAVRSSEAALESNRIGYRIGTRINTDVLNAQQQLHTAQRDWHKARADSLMSALRLKAAVGELSEADLAASNALLAPRLP